MVRRILVMGGAGYVGSYLVPVLATAFGEVESVDILRRGNPGEVRNRQQDAATLDSEYLAGFEDLVLLAGHSSVAQCIADPAGALQNNLVLFQHVLDRMAPLSRLFYASSGSVYDGSRAHRSDESDVLTAPRNIYDLTKTTVDAIASLSDRQCIGLRFGTVVGVSPNIRAELLLNSMVRDAVTTGIIRLANPMANRAILGISDLALAIRDLIGEERVTRGIFNVLSENVTMAEVAERVAQVTSASVQLQPDSPTYDFSMSADKLENTVAWRPQQTVESIAAQLVELYSAG